MKKLFVLICLLAFSIVKAQVPDKVNYQGIARDASGNIVTSSIGLKFEIHQGSAGGPVIYDETHTVNPSSAGIFTAAIGGGVVGTGNFSTINWGTNSYFLAVSIDPAGGTSYSTVGTSQLLSVPYALYAKTSGNAAATYSAGNGISISSGSIINTSPNQTVNISGPAVTGAYPSYTITTPAALTASTGISIVGGTVTNTAPDKTLTLVGLGSATVGGVYPNFTISTPVISALANTLVINAPHSINTIGPNNHSITIQPTNLSGPNVLGTYPNYTIGAGAPTVITGTGVTNVITAGNNFTVNTPPVNMSFVPTSGVLSYSPAIGTNTINISPAITFTNNVITIGTTTASIPVTGIWTKPSLGVTTLSNPNDNVGIGIATPNNRLDVLESANGIAAVNAVNTFTTVSAGSAMGLWAESSNPNGSSAGVYAVHNGGGNGVSGISNTTTYSNTAGVYGYAAGSFSSNVSIQADVQNGNSTGIFANSFAGHNGIALYSLKAGSAGNAAKIEIANPANPADALLATTNGSGAAMRAIANNTTSAVSVLLDAGHLKAMGTVATLTGTAVSGGFTAPTGVVVSGNDVRGVVTFSTSATGFSATNGADVVIQFQKSYGIIPNVVVSPTTDMMGLSFMVINVGTSTFTIRVYRPSNMTVPITIPSSLFRFNYHVIE